MYVLHKDFKAPSSVLSSTEDFDIGSLSDSIEPQPKPLLTEHGFAPRAGGLVKGLVNSIALAKSQSICTLNDKPVSPRTLGTDVNEALRRIMLRRGSQIDTAYEDEHVPRTKHNSLVSIMVSTIMCLAANCPIPRSNIQATKLFLSTVVNENGESPRNIKALVTLLKNYDGPYEGETPKVTNHQRLPSTVETVINTTEVALEPTVSPPIRSMDKVRTSRLRSRLPSLSPVKRSTDQRKHSWNA